MVLFPLAIVFYLVAIHACVISGNFVAALLILLSPAVFMPARRNRTSRVILLAALAGTLLLLSRGFEDYQLLVLYIPPVLINAGLAIVFGQSLRAGNVPLVTRYSIVMRGKLEPDVVSYTRCVTWLWTGFFIVLSLESLLLALYAPVEIWSMFANLLNYLFTAGLFIGEYVFRIRHLKSVSHPSFPQFLLSVTRITRELDQRQQ